MQSQRTARSRQLCALAGSIALGTATQTWAANLLINPSFEAPAAAGSTSPDFTGWTPVNDINRSVFNQTLGNPPAGNGTWNVWNKTFQDVGGSISQDVGNITVGATYDLSVYTYFEANYVDSLATTKLGLTFLDNGNQTVGTPTFTLIPFDSGVTTDEWAQQTASAVAPVGATKVRVTLGWDNGQVGFPNVSSFFDLADLEGPGIPPSGFTWAPDGSGDWNIGGNWASGTVPNAIGDATEFFGAITSAQTVYTNSPVTVGSMNFNNANTYVISGAGMITIQVAAGSGAILVQNGTHNVNLPVRFASNSTVTANAGAVLNMADPVTIAASRTVTTSGNVQFNAPLTLETGAQLVIGPSATAVRVFNAPSLGSGAKVNVQSNAMVVDYNPGASPLATIASQVRTAYAGGGIFAWTGSGITTSTGNANNFGVGFAERSALTTVPAIFGTVDIDSILVRRTRFGDADLNGQVNSDDFNRLASNFGTSGKVWSQGNFNYDIGGLVNSDDFNMLATNFGLVATGVDGEVTPQDWANLAAAVPEPSTGLLLAGLATSVASVRRRRN
jgi:hypothetical protein